MLEGIKNFFRKAGAMLGLIKKVNEVTDLKKIPLSEDYYRKIEMWQQLHAGYYADMHDDTAFTIAGKKPRKKATLGMPKVVAQKLASLIFNERCEISVSDEVFAEFVADVFKDNSFDGNFQQHLEFMFAQGGMAIKPYPEMQQNGSYAIKLAYVTASCFYPISWDNTRVLEGVFVSQVTKDKKIYTHLEWHVKDGTGYMIKNELYENQSGSLGHKVPLSTIYPDMAERVEFQNLTRPLFTYIKPNLANNIDPTSPLGVSVYANSYDTLNQIDTWYDSFGREPVLGKKRLIVSNHAVRTRVEMDVTGTRPEFKRYFDEDNEIYEALDHGDMDSGFVKEIDMKLRVQEHVDAINAQLNILAMQVGFSSGAFSFDAASGLKTATEVVSEQSDTFRTKQSHENTIEAGIADVVEVVGILGELYGLCSVPAEYDVTVFFDDSIAQDRTSDINEQALLLTNGLQSKLKAIMKLHGLTEDEAKLLLKEIKAEELAQQPSFEDLQRESALFGERE